MRKHGKVLVFILAFALLVGAVFAVASSAADKPREWYSEDLSGVLTGATRLHRDFTAESFDIHGKIDGSTAASPVTSEAINNMRGNVSSKFGQLRSVTGPDGNTYYEYAIRTDIDDTGTTGRDVYAGIQPNGSISVANLSYVTFEFDMMTPTDFPSNIQIYLETRFYVNGNEEGSKVRTRQVFCNYDKANGEWDFKEKTVSIARGEWAHVTLVFQINKVISESVDAGSTVNYNSSIAKAYVNGEYVGQMTGFFPNKAYAADIDARIYYTGVGYNYKTSVKGTKADDAIALDNMVYTTYTTAYEEDPAAKLPSLFGDNPVTNITNLGAETVWTDAYTLPAKTGDAQLIGADGTVYGAEEGVTSVHSALAFAKEKKLVGATLKLFANQYNTLKIDYPLTIDLNGYALSNGYEVSDNLALEVDAQTNNIVVSSDPSKLLTVNYYDMPKELATSPTLVYTARNGVTVVSQTGEIDAELVAVDGKNAYTYKKTFVIYDADGNVAEALPTTVTEEMLGKSWSVYPAYEVSNYENNVQFSVYLDGKYTFYDVSDLQAACVLPAVVKSAVTEDNGKKSWTETQYYAGLPTGAAITLYADCTTSKPLFTFSGNFSLDLNGYELSTTKDILTFAPTGTSTAYTQTGDEEPVAGKVSVAQYLSIKNNQVYIYSSAKGASMTTTGRVIFADAGIGTSNGVKAYIGYQNASTASEHRFDVTFGDKLFHLQKGTLRYVYFANVDLYNTVYNETGLNSAAQSRGLDVYFTDTNLFTISPITGSTANSGAKTIHFIRSNVYAKDGVKMNYVKSNSTATSATVYNLTESKIYGMPFGMTAGDADVGSSSAYLTINLKDTVSRISATRSERVNLGVTGTIAAMPETVTINGVTYATIYGIDTENKPTATFEFYNVGYDWYTEDMTPAQTLAVVKGYWFASIEVLADEFFYDFENSPTVAGVSKKTYSVYDENGNVVPAGAAVAGETYKVFIDCEKDAVAIAVIESNGKATPYLDNNLSLIEVPANSTVVLLADECYMPGIKSGNKIIGFVWNNVKLDLNGKIFYNTEKVNTFNPEADSSIFIYSSKEGAKYYQAKAAGNNCGYVTRVTGSNAKFYFGYQDADTVSPCRITVHCGAFSEITSSGGAVYLANLDLYKISGDNYGFLNFRDGGAADRNYYVDNCNIYASGNFVGLRGNSNNGEVTFRNTKVYTTGTGGFVTYQEAPTTPQLVINFENVEFYGASVNSIGSVPACTELTVNIKGTFKAPFVSDKFVFEDGMVLMPKADGTKLPGYTAPASGVYGAEETVYFKGDFNSRYALVTEKEFLKTLYQNVSLVSDINLNTYVPVSEFISEIKVVGGENLLDAENTVTMGAAEYYVITVGEPAKNAYVAHQLVITFANGTEVTLDASLSRYAKRLLSTESEDEYVLDSQELMAYVLHYIKTTAIEYSDAVAEEIFADIEYTVNDEVVFEEATDLSLQSINKYVEGGALDLDACAGFAFKVADGFVGTIKVQLGESMIVEKTYTADAAAGEDEILYLEEVPAHALRYTIVITATPEGGEAVSASFNLATYVNYYIAKDYARAVYLYACKAKAFGVKYSA